MKNGQKTRKVEILLVEDNPGDVDLFLEAIAGTGLDARVSVASNGEEAVSTLRARRDESAGPLPDLVFLDLNLPRKDGREVLAEVKADGLLKHIPVIVLTSSEAERDLRHAYGLHANCLVTKPVDLEEFLGCIQATVRFWLSIAKIPNPAAG